MKEKVKALWKLCFDDSDQFIDMYFRLRYKSEINVVIESGNEVISALQMLPYVMTYYGKEISVNYIYGACTLPSERGQGLMRQLIQKAFEVMESRKVALTVIIPADPWLFDYYRDLGYTEAFDYSEETYIRPSEIVLEQGVLVVPPEVPSMESLYNFFNKKQRERICYVLHGYDDFVTILRELQMSGGQMLTALNIQEEPIGMIFFYPVGDYIYVKELMYDNDNIKNLLLQEATTQSKVEKAVCRTPFTGPGTFPLGMARVLDRDRLIHHWAFTHANSVHNIGELKKMDTQSLTRLLLDYQSREAYMSLMLD